jgi:hypothetical protein
MLKKKALRKIYFKWDRVRAMAPKVIRPIRPYIQQNIQIHCRFERFFFFNLFFLFKNRLNPIEFRFEKDYVSLN